MRVEDFRGALVKAKRDGREWAESVFAAGLRPPRIDWEAFAKSTRALNEHLGAIATEIVETTLAAGKNRLGELISLEAREAGPITRVTKIQRLARDGKRTETTAVVTRSTEWELPEDRTQAVAVLDELHATMIRIQALDLVGSRHEARDVALTAIDSRDPIAYLEALQALERAIPKEAAA